MPLISTMLILPTYLLHLYIMMLVAPSVYFQYSVGYHHLLLCILCCFATFLSLIFLPTVFLQTSTFHLMHHLLQSVISAISVESILVTILTNFRHNRSRTALSNISAWAHVHLQCHHIIVVCSSARLHVRSFYMNLAN